MIQRYLLLLFILFLIPEINAQEPRPSVRTSKQRTASKQVSTFTIEAPQLQSTKKIWVYLPQNYATSKRKLSVIYMHDAQNLFDATTSYSGEWNIDEKLDSLKAPVIVIGVEHGNEKRIDELTPFKNEKYGGGKADRYLEFIVKTLKPHIDKTFRTKTDKKNTIIMGSSLGGLTSYYAVLKYPEIFGKAGVFSPSFWFTKDIYDLTEKSKKIKSKIYFLCGDNESEDMVTDLNKMEYLLNSNRCSCLNLNEKKIVKGGQHNEKLWRDGFVKAVLWLGY
ncbi:alpha/beta hydrolase [Flavobacterium sp. GSP27]|uniref:alpha/beta hydrolase n=1 Tax=unclassified Flavobacterium TaxID=196869 RepID=UPI000F8426C2|nr:MULTISPECIES: alpha/beta hydrolase-fold protein [unclassified Flavobacterium]RTY89407.1 alpha/beta hydrolase [Flavobacterium sp. GSN2]RTY99692.1 alpha/beta hydrolase [Flavobacterium sp. RSP49]RTZ09627.1 alpha/beta hydrolase [Flavobacterium sp. GSP27]